MKNVHVDIDKMGAWTLRKHGLELLSSNGPESFNAQLKRFLGDREMSVDMLVLALQSFQEYRMNEVMLAQYGIGGEWTLRPHLTAKYDKNDPRVTLPKLKSPQDYINEIKAARAQPIPLPVKLYVIKRLLDINFYFTVFFSGW